MTTSVKVMAHCSKSVEVAVEVGSAPAENKVLQDGEETTVTIYDARSVLVYERVKPQG